LHVSDNLFALVSRRLPNLPVLTLQMQVGELLKFLELAANSDARWLPISEELDAVWHAFILETREYAALCAQAGHFVHHTSMSPRLDCESRQQQLDDDLQFVVAYLRRFGEFPEAALPLWPALARLSSHLRMSTDALLLFAQELSGHPSAASTCMPLHRQTLAR
jgi:hypothetical protein